MAHLRRVLSRLAVTWLLCQAAALTLVPAGLGPGTAGALFECTCSHSDHAICPMHHRPAPGSQICLMVNASGNPTAVLTSLFTGAGPLPAASAAAVAEPTPAFADTGIAPPSRRPVPPDPPPPRA